jgi:hypothetical protein
LSKKSGCAHARTREKKLFEIQPNGVEPHNITVRVIFKNFLIFVVFVIRAAKIREICVTLFISMW